MGLDLSTWEDRSCDERERSLQRLSETEASEEEPHREPLEEMQVRGGEEEAARTLAQVVVRERARTLDDSNQKTRAKRESRRMRELEQAKFSLELLKVRSTQEFEERRWSIELPSESIQSPQGTPDSQSSKGSFELLSMDDYPKDRAPYAEAEDLGSPTSAPEEQDAFCASPKSVVPPESLVPESPKKEPAAQPVLPKLENSLPTFYVPPVESSSVVAKPSVGTASTSTLPETPAKSLKDRRESSRRPVVVVISMQKECFLNEGSKSPEVRDSSAQTSEPPSPAQADGGGNLAVLERLEKLNEEKQERRKQQQQQNEKEMMDQIRQQKEILEKQRKHFAQYEREMFEKQRGEALQRIEQSRLEGSGGAADRCSSVAAERAPIAQPELDLISGSPRAQVKQAAPSTVRERPKDKRTVPDGWAPKLTLESRDGTARGSPHKKPPTPSVNINMGERPGNIFFSPKDKASFSK